jgi:hypothetical protein
MRWDCDKVSPLFKVSWFTKWLIDTNCTEMKRWICLEVLLKHLPPPRICRNQVLSPSGTRSPVSGFSFQIVIVSICSTCRMNSNDLFLIWIRIPSASIFAPFSASSVSTVGTVMLLGAGASKLRWSKHVQTYWNLASTGLNLKSLGASLSLNWLGLIRPNLHARLAISSGCTLNIWCIFMLFDFWYFVWPSLWPLPHSTLRASASTSSWASSGSFDASLACAGPPPKLYDVEFWWREGRY